jgi:hypothetical protein
MRTATDMTNGMLTIYFKFKISDLRFVLGFLVFGLWVLFNFQSRKVKNQNPKTNVKI